jgi:hypothetical protein
VNPDFGDFRERVLSVLMPLMPGVSEDDYLVQQIVRLVWLESRMAAGMERKRLEKQMRDVSRN